MIFQPTLGICFVCVFYVNQPVPKAIHFRVVFYAEEDGDTFRFLDELGLPAGNQDDSKVLKHFLNRYFTSFNTSFHFIISFTRSCDVSVTQTADVFFKYLHIILCSAFFSFSLSLSVHCVSLQRNAEIETYQ